eukprot:CAMPEP_0169293950 /NCGR_PEP_ID=MMETSP1016-20121227/63594_1 /TAXON_ID=342587 /ORGANISM="Karlodinium micrum, Strain CCMP2283" /LENGTH=32 /DNA_ID= /DNA_START= /DNA_END= /DNA_ORIENTATION=
MTAEEVSRGVLSSGNSKQDRKLNIPSSRRPAK